MENRQQSLFRLLTQVTKQRYPVFNIRVNNEFAFEKIHNYRSLHSITECKMNHKELLIINFIFAKVPTFYTSEQ